ncbi:hypothetical protein H1R20_g13908, partial [Candolleomyces eurysporus]
MNAGMLIGYYTVTHIGFILIGKSFYRCRRARIADLQFTGTQLCLCHLSVLALTRTPKEMRKNKLPFLALTVLITALYILHAALGSITLSELLIGPWRERSNFVYLLQSETLKRMTTGSATGVALDIIGNGILIYRCYVIWQGYRWVPILPTAIYLVSIAMSVLYLMADASPRVSTSVGGAIGTTVWGTLWFLLSVAVNIMVTALISFKIIREQKRLGSVLNAHRTRVYTDIVAILIESAFPFTVFGIVAGVLNAVGSVSMDLSSALIEAWFAFCALSPQLIIFRVMTGRAWSNGLETSPSDFALSQPIAFAKDNGAKPSSTSSSTELHDP